jgi:hypothetical protein
MNKLQTTAVVSIILLIIAFPLNAAVPATPFQILGHIQNFCLDNQFNSATNSCPKDTEPRTPIPPFNAADLANTQFIGAKIVVNGITVTIPGNTVVLMPASYLTPWQIFAMAQGVSRDNNESGLALQDKTPPLAAFEAAIDGNIVCIPPASTCTYIAGLVHISQQGLNIGAGYIRKINSAAGDPLNGELCVGADITPVTTCTAPNARVRLNDPKIDEPADPGFNDGRYGRANPTPPVSPDPNSRFPDPRFTVDQDNPTVHAATGYPMCVPRSGNDQECPQQNRPVDGGVPLKFFVMGPSDLTPPAAGFPANTIKKCSPACDPNKQAPLKEGDYVTYQGTLAQDSSGIYISAHTVGADVGIYTEPGKDPAYVTLDESLIGTRGNITNPAPQPRCGLEMECQDRIKVEGFTTDPSRPVNVYAVDVTPATPNGVTLVRRIGPGIMKPAPLGRYRLITQKNAGVLFASNGTEMGATRELLARVGNGAGFPVGVSLSLPNAPLTAHGLKAGQYQAPVGEYIFPEGLAPGALQPQLNFQCLAFLVNGWKLGTDAIPPLTPWPGNISTLSCLN